MTAVRSVDLRYVAKSAARILAVTWLAIFALAYAAQRKMIYVPVDGPRDPAAVGLAHVTVETIATPDGARLVAWRAAAKPGLPTVLFFHGNSGALAHRHAYFERFRDAGYGFYAFSYRSFSGSTGSPTEADNIADALLVYDRLRASGVAARDIVLMGESLGSGVAVQLAAEREVAAVVLESPYSSVADVAAHRFWFLPARWVLKDQYNSVAHIQRVKAPVLILAGTTDTVIPVQFSRTLAAATPATKKYVEYPKGWHVDTFSFGGFDEMRAWIGRHHTPLTGAGAQKSPG